MLLLSVQDVELSEKVFNILRMSYAGVQVHSLPKALRLNPKADAQALAHDGVLVLLNPQSLVRAEAHTKPDSLAMQGLQPQPSQSSGHQTSNCRRLNCQCKDANAHVA